MKSKQQVYVEIREMRRALARVYEEPPDGFYCTRETALVITKLQEAEHWAKADLGQEKRT